MDKNASGMPVDQAAAELGVPADALRLYVTAHKLSDPATVIISAEQIAKLQEELRTRAGALRLDDLAKTALTIEWLAETAVAAARNAAGLEASLSKLTDTVAASKGADVKAELAPLNSRIDALESVSKDSVNVAVQKVGSLQTMVEANGREVDKLRSELASLTQEFRALSAKHLAIVGALRAAFEAEPGTASRPKATAAQNGAAVVEAEAAAPPAAKRPKAEPQPEPPAPAFVNTEVTTPVKYRVKREIEYNFLLERMAYRRLDSYGDEEKPEKLDFPEDDEIRTFLGKYELGCDPEEVEMVSVQRGEYHMVQYQRVERTAGIKNWIKGSRN